MTNSAGLQLFFSFPSHFKCPIPSDHTSDRGTVDYYKWCDNYDAIPLPKQERWTHTGHSNSQVHFYKVFQDRGQLGEGLDKLEYIPYSPYFHFGMAQYLPDITNTGAWFWSTAPMDRMISPFTAQFIHPVSVVFTKVGPRAWGRVQWGLLSQKGSKGQLRDRGTEKKENGDSNEGVWRRGEIGVEVGSVL